MYGNKVQTDNPIFCVIVKNSLNYQVVHCAPSMLQSQNNAATTKKLGSYLLEVKGKYNSGYLD